MTTSNDPPGGSGGTAAAVAIRRYVNDEIAETASRLQIEERSQIEFLCECGSLSCRGRLTTMFAGYQPSAPGSIAAH